MPIFRQAVPISSLTSLTLAATLPLACAPSDRTDGGLSGGLESSGSMSGGMSGSGTSEGSGSGSGDSSGGSGGGSGSESGGGDSSGDSGGVRFDVGGATSGGSGGGLEGGTSDGCQKVDFVFVIDSSSSMKEEQLALTASFPGFIEEIQRVVQADDYRILVLDTDATPSDSGCPGKPGTCSDEWCAKCWAWCTDDCSCDGPCAAPPACDMTLGSGKTVSNEGAPCNVEGGARYMTQAQTDLNGTFACLAEVGVKGDTDEKPMQAAIEGITLQSEAGACNDGFLRDDAILVMTIITDEIDGDSIPHRDAAAWRNAMVEAKNGDESAIVALAILYGGDADPACTDSGAEARSPEIEAWAMSFTHGNVGSTCAPDYAPFFMEAVSIIDVACDDFIPPG